MTIADYLLRAGFVVVGLGLWFWSQTMISGNKAPPPTDDAIGDRLHLWSTPLHRRLTANPREANATLIATSFFIDVLGLYMLAAAIFGPTLRPFLAVLVVFVMRQLCQVLVTLPAPDGVIWRHPGFPSLLVTYHVGNDYFFSGHTAIACVAALQLLHAAPPWLAAVGIVIAAVEAGTVIVLRAHYTMDVFAAILAAWAADTIATSIASWCDSLLNGLG